MRFLEMDSPLCLGSSQVAKGICAAKVGCGDQTPGTDAAGWMVQTSGCKADKAELHNRNALAKTDLQIGVKYLTSQGKFEVDTLNWEPRGETTA